MRNLAARTYYAVSDTLQEFALARDPVRYWHWELRRRGHKKEREFSLMPFFCKGGGTMVDVGTNKGAYLALSLGYVQRAVAFEPHPHLASLLSRAFAREEVRVHNVALGSEIDEVKLRIPRGQWGRSTVEENNPLLNLRGLVDEVTVPRRTLDSFGLTDVSFIKIDVEGHEHCVLVGALETIRRERPIVFVEAEERHRRGTVAAVRELLEGVGYRGAFLSREEIVDIDHFHLPVHQAPNQSTYIRDFVFVPDDADLRDLRAFWETCKGAERARM